MAKKKSGRMIPDTVTKLIQAEVESPTAEFQNAKEFKNAYDNIHQDVLQAMEASSDRQVDLVRALAKMRALLSERGTEKMRRQAGIKIGWGAYFKAFQKRFNLKMCLRTVINKIDLLEGKKLCPQCQSLGRHNRSCPQYRKPTKCLSQLEAGLLGAVSSAHEVCKAIEQGGNFDEAIQEFRERAPSRERIGEYINRQAAPYELKAGDFVAVGRRTYILLGIPGEVACDEEGIVTLTLRMREEGKPAQSQRASNSIAKSA
jgi:hypothetical protein